MLLKFELLSKPMCLRVLSLLESNPLCVCLLRATLEASKHQLSRDLAELKKAGWLISCGRGSSTVYRFNACELYHLGKSVIESHAAGLREILREDRERLATLIEPVESVNLRTCFSGNRRRRLNRTCRTKANAHLLKS